MFATLYYLKCPVINQNIMKGTKKQENMMKQGAKMLIEIISEKMQVLDLLKILN